MFNFNGKKILITGATGGIGESVSNTFISLGATVFITSSSENKLQKLKTELCNTYQKKKDNIFLKSINLENLTEVSILCEIANETMKGLDIVICNAGITRDALGVRMKIQDWQSVIDINLTANFIINRDAIKIMMRKKYGRIINIASVVGLTGNIGQVNYVSSKAGLIGMTKSFAIETASRGITVNAIAPGFIKTEMTNKLSDQVTNEIMIKIPMERYGEPKDIANACSFLASEEANYITGETLNINGGMFMN